MNAFVLIAASLLAIAAAAPHGEELLIKGPSGIITPHGPIGPTGPAHGGEEHYHHGGEDNGQYHGEGAYHHVPAPAAHYYVAPAPAPHHEEGYVAIGHHGVEVKGPHTVPATVSGPSGKVYAKGLYGVPSHPHHHY